MKSNLTFDDMQAMKNLVTFYGEWVKAQRDWVASEPGSDEEATAIEQKRFYADLSYNQCKRLGLYGNKAMEVLNTPLMRDADEYQREINKAAELEEQRILQAAQ